MADLATLQRTLGVSFNEPSLLEQALVHSSYINENPGLAPNSNERLEFLGDAVLGLIAAEKLYQELPYSAEGEMTRLRAALVRRDTLARVARAVRLGDYLYSNDQLYNLIYLDIPNLKDKKTIYIHHLYFHK